MSWSFYAQIPAAATEEEAARILLAARDTAEAQGEPYGPEAHHQQQQAMEAAAMICCSGALGRTAHHVNLSGHANPGHLPRQGWSDDTTNIMVSQVPAVAPPPI